MVRGNALRCAARYLDVQRLDLHRSLRRKQAKVRIKHMQFDATAEIHRNPECTTRLQPRAMLQPRKRPGLHQPDRQCSQDGIAIELLLHRNRRVEMKIHSEMTRNYHRLIQMAGASAPNIEFLQRD